MAKITAVLLLVATCATSAFAAESCLAKFSDASKYADIQTACVTSLKLNASAIVAAADLKTKHFNDNCLSNCTLESMNFLSNGTLLKDKILEEFKKAAPSTEVYDKLAKVVEECVEKANAKPEHNHEHKKGKKDKKTKEAKDGQEGQEGKKHRHGHKKCACKKAAKFMYCVMKKDQDLC